MAIGVRERETVSVSLTPMVTRCPSRRKLSCRLLGTASRFIISLVSPPFEPKNCMKLHSRTLVSLLLLRAPASLKKISNVDIFYRFSF